MYPARADRPTQAQLVIPLLDVLSEHGGSADSRDVIYELAERFDVPAAVRDEVRSAARAGVAGAQRVKIWDRHVRYARQKALAMGYVRPARGEKGLWSLTDEGQEGTRLLVPNLDVCVYVDAAGQPVGATIQVNGALPSVHTIRQGDATRMDWIPDNSVQLIVTSPPYHDLIEYAPAVNQLGNIADWDEFLAMLQRVWGEAYRVLQPGCFAAINVGPVLRARKAENNDRGRSYLLSLPAKVTNGMENAGFLSCNGWRWHKIGNAALENGAGGCLGQPGMPNRVHQLAHEDVLLFVKEGPYRKTTERLREMSRLTPLESATWHQEDWYRVPGERRTPGGHPAPFPIEIPYRVIRLNSYVGDTVLDPFAGTGKTAKAAIRAGRSSVSMDIVPRYVRDIVQEVSAEAAAFSAGVPPFDVTRLGAKGARTWARAWGTPLPEDVGRAALADEDDAIVTLAAD